ncbi:Phosphoribosylformimino-5-aminoimidazole carboxamide ribotide isomerase [Richelia intracellularis HM01]|uniref:1-(5-phosphoribosyl)-5-[(5- phosphoribosylamino)methylideneamino]imidazole-4- carboxamide isomerase n=1 Tax=Richelia intracellularis TaxID=1164990 RepID=UPI0002B5E3D6|nr:1-(5-phosphoribosyl)-5-[(5-phosphoribosylamino)methylideneamino]imidazole-4-carboxamide isomerase [Richelia intracellularis]CCH64534.1 Phosphoribosylformimino-5-aminoimidazole carboxamide ribotide isomerase [Richelia intracellularis HM01]
MEVIPAIDLLEGRCVRLYQGNYEQSQIFSENPVEFAQKWEAQGATRLHIVDLDGAKAGRVINLEAITAIIEATSIPVEVGGGLRSRNSVKELLNLGVQWVILGTIAVEQPQLVEELCQQFPGQIITGIDARDGKVATHGWLETSELLATQLAVKMQGYGAAGVIYTDIYRDGTLSGPNLGALREISEAIDIPVIASGGISSITDLLSLLTLEHQGVIGAIIGRALYNGNISLTKALRAVGPGRIQDIPLDLGSSYFA